MAAKHGLIAVHGMGDAKKGSTLRSVTTKLLQAIRLRKLAEASVTVSGDAEAEDDAHVDISYTLNGTSTTYRVSEYWWAQAFNPASTPTLVRWVIWRASRHPFRIFRVVWHRVWYGSRKIIRKDFPDDFHDDSELKIQGATLTKLPAFPHLNG